MLSDNVTTTGGETKKSSKPVMEKRRRARINASLTELKSLLLEVIKKEGTRHSKMEKADILELTVRHLGQLQKEQVTGMASTDPSGYNKYRVGFNDCFTEMSRFLSSEKDINVELRIRILNHLSNYLYERSQNQLSNGTSSGAGGQAQQTICVSRGSDIQALLSGCVSTGTDVQDKVSNASSKSTCAPQRLLHGVPEIRPTFVQVVNSGTAPNIQSSITSAPPSTSHDRHAAHVTTTMPPPVTIGGEAEVLQPCQANVVHSIQDSLNQVTGVNSENNMLQSLHFLPTKLTSGGMTYVLPANVSVVPSGSIPSYVIPVFTSPDLASGSPIGSQQPLSLATIATPSVPSRFFKEDESSSQYQSPSGSTSAFVPEVKGILPSQGFTPMSPAKLSYTSSSIRLPIRENQDNKPTTSTLSSVLHVHSVSGLSIPVPSDVIRAVPEVAQERANMAEHDVMWRPW
ncbi:uncharacterized protein LOC135475497 [Liolophura sinensis]|uniref:uncharacterized protein LOC135475497 n=1 Tax=Liolophura sinensis TaxID=3198878 RepID=UPI0031585B9C